MTFSKKAILLSGILLCISVQLGAQVRQTREEYISRYMSIAVAHMERYGIPASITMAQGILESDCGNSLLSMVMQLSMSIGVTIAGLLLGLYGQQHMSLDAASTHQVFLYTYLSMAAIIALPALIFSRVPDDVGSNTVLRRRNRSGS